MDIALDPSSPVPLFRQIRDQVVEGIATGELAPGDPLVSVRALAGAFAINPATVAKAYSLLRQDGFVTTNDRSGTIVAPIGSAGSAPWRERLREVLVEGRARGLTTDDMHRELDSVASDFAQAED